MVKLRHPNIVAFLGACSTPPCLVTEYCAQGSLANVLKLVHDIPQLKAFLNWKMRLRMVSAIMKPSYLQAPLVVGLTPSGLSLYHTIMCMIHYGS